VVDELRVDAAFAHSPRDELRVLPAEVDDEDGALLRCRLRHRERHDLAHLVPLQTSDAEAGQHYLKRHYRSTR
jgi:hypothetical protein